MSAPPPAEILGTETSALARTALLRAVSLLQQGEAVALPTETVYGLAANAFDPRAVRRLFDLKGRPARNPVIVHVASLALARECVAEWPETAGKLAAAFWPGPLTMVLPRSEKIPDIVTAGGPTVGIRWPSHPFIQQVIRDCGFPLAAPSANRSSSLSPTTAEHVRKAFGNEIPLIVDGGASQVGIESTVVDLAATPPRLLRPGMIHEESLIAVLGRLTVGFGDSEEILKSPGLLRRHYAPKAKVRIMSWQSESELSRRLAAEGLRLEEVHVIAHQQIPRGCGFGRVSVVPHDAAAFARALYAEMHRCDDEGAKWILVEALPETAEWRALRDRLKRAAEEG